MAFESSGRREFAELVAHHVLSDVNRNELVSIMNCDSVAYEVRGDHAGAGPGLHDLLLLATIIHSKNSLSRASWMYGPFLNERLIILKFNSV